MTANSDDLRAIALARLEADRRQIEGHGYRVLVEIEFCLQNGLTPPAWLCAQLHQRLRTVDTFEVRSLDDVSAFGPTPAPAGQKLPARRAKRLAGVLLDVVAGSTEVKDFPRTLAGRRRLAAFLGTTEPVVRALLPPVKKNKAKATPGLPSAAAFAAADVFGLRQSTKPKRKRALR